MPIDIKAAVGVIYARYSSDKQDDDSIAAQERACREYAAANGIHIVNVYADEAISGKGSKTGKRAKYQKMLRDCERGGIDVILIHKYDRIARNLAEHVSLETRLQSWGVSLVAVAQNFGQSKEGKIVRTLMWSLSEYYIDNLSDEVKKGHRETALKGLHNGGYPPFGYDVVDQRYVINDLEAAYVRKLFDAAAQKQGYTSILQEMRERGIRGKRGKEIKYTQVYEMLRNEKYTGTYTYTPDEEPEARRKGKPHAIKIENALPIIIDRARFEEVQKIMDGRKQTGAKGGYMCSGLVYCECGAKMHATKYERTGGTYRYYYCSKKCGAPFITVEDVDAAAIRYLRTLLSDENQELIAASLRQYNADQHWKDEDFFQVLNSKIRDKERQYDALLANLSSGALPAEVVADVGRQMQDIKEEIAMLRKTEPPKDFTVDQIKAWLESIKAQPDEKAVKMLIERIDTKTDRVNEKTEFSMTSTLNSVLGIDGCGTTWHSFPRILFYFQCNIVHGIF